MLLPITGVSNFAPDEIDNKRSSIGSSMAGIGKI